MKKVLLRAGAIALLPLLFYVSVAEMMFVVLVSPAMSVLERSFDPIKHGIDFLADEAVDHYRTFMDLWNDAA